MKLRPASWYATKTSEEFQSSNDKRKMAAARRHLRRAMRLHQQHMRGRHRFFGQSLVLQHMQNAADELGEVEDPGESAAVEAGEEAGEGAPSGGAGGGGAAA